jgi:hypothetical protein
MILIAKRVDGGVSITRLPDDASLHDEVIFKATHHVEFDANGLAVRNADGNFIWTQRPEYVSWRVAEDSVIPQDRSTRNEWTDEELV